MDISYSKKNKNFAKEEALNTLKNFYIKRDEYTYEIAKNYDSLYLGVILELKVILNIKLNQSKFSITNKIKAYFE